MVNTQDSTGTDVHETTHDSQAGGLLPRAAVVAHDLNNVLTLLSSTALSLQGEAGFIGSARTSLDDLVALTERACALGRQLSTVKPPARREHVDVDELMSTVAAFVGRVLPERVSVRTLCSESLPRLLIDRYAIEQALLNLCLNAAHAVPAGGHLEIGARLAGPGSVPRPASACGLIKLWVSDDGPGIAPDLQKKVFEPFFTTKPSRRGSGLGLASVRDTAQAHGGWVELVSEERSGTTVTMYLPVE